MKDFQNHSIFGIEYKKTENRLTAVLLHIANIGGDKFVRYLLENQNVLLPSPELQITSQYSTGNSIPDGFLSMNCNYILFIESKLNNDVSKKQMESHLKNLDAIQGENKYLIYITKGPYRPANLANGILWYSWNRVFEIFSEYETKDPLFDYLVNQFGLLLEELDLIDKRDNKVIIVGGRDAEDEALKYHYYSCQNNRRFLPAGYLAFYKDNRIKYVFKIKGEPKNNVRRGGIPELSSIDELSYDGPYKLDETVKYFSLDSNPIVVNIENDTKSKSSGRRIPYAHGQRYTTIDRIENARYTSQLSPNNENK